MAETLVKKNADLSDTIRLIVTTIQQNYSSPFIEAINAKLFSSDPNTANYLRRLHDYIYRNVKYQLDPIGKEKVYRPETTISNGNGDCKKQSVIIAAALKRAGIQCYLKHVFYKDQPFTHIYVIVPAQTAKGYITMDATENPTFNNEVQYQRANVYDLNGKKMDLYTGKRSVTENFTAPIYNASRGLMDDMNFITGCPMGSTPLEQAVAIEAQLMNPESMSSRRYNGEAYPMGKKRKSKEERKENRKKISQHFKGVGFGPLRLAFLGLVRINALKLADRLLMLYKKDRPRLEKTWNDFGGNIEQLKETIAKGSKEAISGPMPMIGIVAAATISAGLAAALPIIDKFIAIFKELGISKGEQEDAAMDEQIEGAEERAADQGLQPVNAALQLSAATGIDKAKNGTTIEPVQTTHTGPTAGGFTPFMEINSYVDVLYMIFKGGFYFGAAFALIH